MSGARLATGSGGRWRVSPPGRVPNVLERKRPGSRPQGVPGCFDKETFGGAPVIEQRGQLAVIVNPTEFGASNRKAQSVSY